MFHSKISKETPCILFTKSLNGTVGHITVFRLESGSNSNLMGKLKNGILINDLDGASSKFKENLNNFA